MKKTLPIIIVILLIVIIGGAIYLLSQKSNSSSNNAPGTHMMQNGQRMNGNSMPGMNH